jgi:hypothetical protein
VAFGAPIHLPDADGEDDEEAVDRGYAQVATAMQDLLTATLAQQRAREGTHDSADPLR